MNEAETNIILQSKAVPLRHVGAKGDRNYICCSFLTSSLEG
jgi:hypothetical protein